MSMLDIDLIKLKIFVIYVSEFDTPEDTGGPLGCFAGAIIKIMSWQSGVAFLLLCVA